MWQHIGTRGQHRFLVLVRFTGIARSIQSGMCIRNRNSCYDIVTGQPGNDRGMDLVDTVDGVDIGQPALQRQGTATASIWST
jgi:hypothetical protein